MSRTNRTNRTAKPQCYDEARVWWDAAAELWHIEAGGEDPPMGEPCTVLRELDGLTADDIETAIGEAAAIVGADDGDFRIAANRLSATIGQPSPLSYL